MVSRIKESPTHLFDCFFEVVLPTNNNNKPWILQKFPESFDDQQMLKQVPEFACPCEIQSIPHFSFVLTSIKGQWTFGYCKHPRNSQTCFVFLSSLPWHDTFYKILNKLCELANSQEDLLLRFLDDLHSYPVPDPGGPLHLIYNKGRNTFNVQCVDHLSLPSIPEDKNLTEYFNVASINNMIIIFASMLHERRIIMTSSRMNKLSGSIQAANALIYPMQWQHIFIPVLPAHLLDYLQAPMPFLVGVPASTFTEVRLGELGDFVIYDLDANVVTTPFNDLEAFPSGLVSTLKRKLKIPNALFGDGVSQAFLYAVVQLIGGYRDAISVKSGEKITFDEELFLKTRPSSMQPFLTNILTLQIFQQFIEGQLDKLNTGEGFNDTFENMVAHYEEKSNNKFKQQYKEWMYNMKKGGAILKNVRTKASNKGKRAYHDLRGRIFRLQPNKGQFNAIDNQPKSAPSSPTASHHRPISLQINKPIQFVREEGLQATLDDLKSTAIRDVKALHYTLLNQEALADDEDADFESITFERINMDLMGDLQDYLFSSSISDSTMEKTSQKSSDSSGSLPPPPQNVSKRKASMKTECSSEPSLIVLDPVNDEQSFDPLEANYKPETPFLPPANNSSALSSVFKPNPQFFPSNLTTPLYTPTFSVMPNSIISPTNYYCPPLANNLQYSNASNPSSLVPTNPISNSQIVTSPDPFADLIAWPNQDANNKDKKTNWQTFQ